MCFAGKSCFGVAAESVAESGRGVVGLPCLSTLSGVGFRGSNEIEKRVADGFSSFGLGGSADISTADGTDLAAGCSSSYIDGKVDDGKPLIICSKFGGAQVFDGDMSEAIDECLAGSSGLVGVHV